MAKLTVSLPQGTRDFGPEVVGKRQYIIQTIRDCFELYGFEPLETPAMENLSTLMGKYGDEGDKLIFKILNNGLDDPKKRDTALADFHQIIEGKNNTGITERALRYDLTIPFARFVAMNQGQLTMPFKRYQIQPVWRADRPQKGRYREFYQCDADIVGSRSLLNEAELAALYAAVFSRLAIKVDIRINNRKILAALAEKCGGENWMGNITIAIDKLDKIGIENVKAELLERGLNEKQWDIIHAYLQIGGSNREQLKAATDLLGDTDRGREGLADLDTVLSYFDGEMMNEYCNLQIDFTLARGLNYYTGSIFEVKARDFAIGSIGGGGRYDDLTGLFGVPGIAGVGISFGLDRIYDVMEGLALFPASAVKASQALFFNLGDKESRVAWTALQELRSKGIRGEIYPEQAKFDKQFKYAQKKNIPYVVLIGSQEIDNRQCVIKQLESGEQFTIGLDELSEFTFS